MSENLQENQKSVWHVWLPTFMTGVITILSGIALNKLNNLEDKMDILNDIVIEYKVKTDQNIGKITEITSEAKEFRQLLNDINQKVFYLKPDEIRVPDKKRYSGGTN